MANESVFRVKDEDLIIDFRESVYSQLEDNFSEIKQTVNGKELTIKKLKSNEKVMPQELYGEMKEELEISYAVRDESENANFGISVNMDPDQNCIAIEKEYIRLLTKSSIPKEDLIFNVLPHIDIPELEYIDDTPQRRFNPQKITNLTYYSKQDISFINSNVSKLESSTTKFKNTLKRVIRFVRGKVSKETEKAKGIRDLRAPGAKTTKGAAVIVHGLASSINHKYDRLAKFLGNEGYSVYGFDYNTVGTSIKDTGKQLSDEINRLKGTYDNILVVSHSMGGLVSRSALVYDKAGIDKLIMAGTPNNGSDLIGSRTNKICLPNKRNLIKILLSFIFLFQTDKFKLKDFEDLLSDNHAALDQLTSKGTFIDDLNDNDQIEHIKNYFSLTGDYLIKSDGIVSSEGTYSINEIKIPHIRNNWSHINYFDSNEMDKAMKKAIEYLG